MTYARQHDPRPNSTHCAICAQCDWVMRVDPPQAHELACCPRCNHPVAAGRIHHLHNALAWALSALIMLALVFGFDFLSFASRGIDHTMSFIDTIYALVDTGYPALALLFALTTAVLPALFLLGTIYMSAAAMRPRPLPLAITAARLVHGTRGWMMSDVLLVGILVSLIKIITMAQISLGPSFIVFCLFCLLLLRTLNVLDWPQLWPAIAGPATAGSDLQPGHNARTQNMARCDACGAPFVTRGAHRCQRCGKRHWLHRVSRLQLTWALLLTALLLYVPANIYPIMTTHTLVGGEGQTIAGGVLQLIAMGSWPIALVIFMASIVIPLTKIGALAWLCLCSRYGLHQSNAVQARLFRYTERIGRWSMIDVFVVSVLAALVQAGAFLSIEPGPAAVSFAAVVILTMLAAETFDTRLLWRDKEQG